MVSQSVLSQVRGSEVFCAVQNCKAAPNSRNLHSTLEASYNTQSKTTLKAALHTLIEEVSVFKATYSIYRVSLSLVPAGAGLS